MGRKHEDKEAKLTVSVSLMHELQNAFRKAGISDREWTPPRIKSLVERPKLLAGLLKVLSGQAQITLIEHVVNLTKNPPQYPQHPSIPSKVHDHKAGHFHFKLDFTKIGLFKPSSKISYDSTRKSFSGGGIEDLSMCNATLLGYLIEHRNSGLIPDEMRPDIYGGIVFLGTVFVEGIDVSFGGDPDEIDDDPIFWVRMLCWDNGQGWFFSYQPIHKLNHNRILIAHHIK